MHAQRAYLDYNASAPLLETARAAMLAALDAGGNASSVHAEGRAARRLIEEARGAVAALVGGVAEHVVFTSGASEAASMLTSPDWRMGRAPLRLERLFVAASDHPCLLDGGRFAPENVHRLPVGRDGLLDPETVRAVLAKNAIAGKSLVAIHAANNETGVIQPIAEIASAAKQAGALFALDAVQAAGRIALDIADLGADFLILSAHKIGGPKGAGALVAASGLVMPEPLVRGGGQEKGHRGGTENVAAIAGFGAAAREAARAVDLMDGVRALRDEAERAIREIAPHATIFGAAAPRLANTSFFAVPGLKAETAQIGFDLAGIALSAGSACSSGKVGPSHVLAAMGYGEEASALRLSLGLATEVGDIERFATALRGIVARGAGQDIRAA